MFAIRRMQCCGCGEIDGTSRVTTERYPEAFYKGMRHLWLGETESPNVQPDTVAYRDALKSIEQVTPCTASLLVFTRAHDLKDDYPTREYGEEFKVWLEKQGLAKVSAVRATYPSPRTQRDITVYTAALDVRAVNAFLNNQHAAFVTRWKESNAAFETQRKLAEERRNRDAVARAAAIGQERVEGRL